MLSGSAAVHYDLGDLVPLVPGLSHIPIGRLARVEVHVAVGPAQIGAHGLAQLEENCALAPVGHLAAKRGTFAPAAPATNVAAMAATILLIDIFRFGSRQS